jgi:phi13 family phage major tail protein
MYYAKITEDDMGNETYGIPVNLAKAITAELSIELAEATLYADDGAAYVIKDFKSGKLTLGVDDIGLTVAQDLTGAAVDDNGVLVSASENEGTPVAIGFRAMKPNGKYRYFWVYRVKFGVPSTNLQTKGDSITFQTPSIEGTIMRRNKVDGKGKHPWKAEVTDGDPGVPAAVITGWYAQVYEPQFTAVTSRRNPVTAKYPKARETAHYHRTPGGYSNDRRCRP